MADPASAIPPHTLPRNKPLATVLRGGKASFFGKKGETAGEIEVYAWGETTYADTPQH